MVYPQELLGKHIIENIFTMWWVYQFVIITHSKFTIYNFCILKEPHPVTLNKSVEWKVIDGVMKLVDVEATGYVIDVLDGLRVSRVEQIDR